MPVAFVGPSYSLETRSADVQRTINMRPVPVESGSGRSQFMLQSNPGLDVLCSIGGGEGRGAVSVRGRMFYAIGTGLYEVYTNGTYVLRGSLATSAGRVSMNANSVEMFMVDGVRGYTLKLSDNTFRVLAATPGLDTSIRCAYLDQYAIYVPADGQAFYISSLGAAGTVDPLDFASAEGAPDNITSFLVANRQLYLFGETSTEIWLNTGVNPDMPLQRYDGTVMGIGCFAPQSPVNCNGVPVWVGASEEGIGSVWMADGYSPRRISTRAVEEVLSTSSDLSQAYAYSMSWHGSAMYCLRAPGLDTTWAYDFLSQSWHEQAEFSNGLHQQFRVCETIVCAGSVYALGDDGVVYRLNQSTNNFAGDTMCRERISPHDVASGQRQFFPQFEMVADSGVTGEAMLRMSNDGGAVWGDWRRRSLGELGTQKQRILWNRCGSARDRVWHVRCTDDVPFSIVEARV